MKLFDWFKSGPAIDAPLRARIDRAVTATEPRIRQLPGYEKQLAAGVTAAYDHCERIALAVPGPFAINRAAFASDPLVHALFGGADEIAVMLGASQPVRDYLAAHPDLPETPIYALLGMRRSLNAGFGARLAGDIIQRDEPQTTLSFSDHTLAEPCPDLDRLHQQLALSFFDGLLKGLATEIETRRQELFELREHLALDKAMRRTAGGATDAAHIEALQARIAEMGEALMPAALLPRLNEILLSASTRLHIEPTRYRIDRFGVVVEGDDAGIQADTIRLVELVMRDQRHWVAMCVRFEHGEARDALAALSERRRHMVI